MAIHILTGIFVIGLLILATAIGILLSRFSQQPQAYRWLTYTLLFSLSCDLLSVVLRLSGGQANIGGMIYNVFFIGLFSIFFYYILGGRLLRYLLYGVNAGYLVFVVSNAVFIQRLTINSYSSLVGAIIVLVLSVLYYFKLLRDLPVQRVYDLPLFWIVSGLFFTKSGKLVIYTVIQYLTEHYNDNLIRLWMVHNSLTVVENLMILYGAWLQYRGLQRSPKLT